MTEPKYKRPTNSWSMDDDSFQEHLKKLDAETSRLELLRMEGIISEAEYQSAINELYQHFPDRQTFYDRLKTFIRGLVLPKIYSKPPRLFDYSSKYSKKTLEVEMKFDWMDFWMSCEWLDMPSQQDIDALRTFQDSELVQYTGIIGGLSLKPLIDADLQDSETAKRLYEHYKLLKQEIANRGLDYPSVDAVQDYIKHKEKYKKRAKQLEEARVTGNMCIYCHGTDVRSYGKAEWKCYDCNRRFRKH